MPLCSGLALCGDSVAFASSWSPAHRPCSPGNPIGRKDLRVCRAEEGKGLAHQEPRSLFSRSGVFLPGTPLSVVPMHLHPNSFRIQPADYLNGCSVLKYAGDTVCEIIETYLSMTRKGQQPHLSPPTRCFHLYPSSVPVLFFECTEVCVQGILYLPRPWHVSVPQDRHNQRCLLPQEVCSSLISNQGRSHALRDLHICKCKL